MPPEWIGFALGFLLGGAVGVIATSTPTWLFLRDCPKLWGNDFALTYPSKAWVPAVYPLAVVSSLFGLIVLGGEVLMYVQVPSLFFLFYNISCTLASGTGVLNGLFEILTGVSPVTRGRKRWGDFYVKAPWLHQYIYDKEVVDIVRKAGIVRVVLGLSTILLSFLVSWLASGWQ